MKEFIVPDKISVIDIEDGTIRLHEAYDVIHRWNIIGFHLLKYWNQDAEPPSIQNIAIDAAGADFLHDQAKLSIVDRDTITEHEHEIYLSWAISNIDEDFKL